LWVEEISVRGHLFPSSHSFREAHARQAYSFVKQLFVRRIRQPVALLPGSFVFPPVPAKKLRQQPLARLLLRLRLWIGRNSSRKSLSQLSDKIELFL